MKTKKTAAIEWRRKHRSGRLLRLLCAVLAAVLCLGAATVYGATPEDVKEETESARPSVNGKLAVDGAMLVDSDGTPVLLRGVSTHGVTWFPDMVDPKLFQELSTDWDCNLVRLAVYSSEYALGDKQQCLDLTRKGIEAAIAADQYVIVDWHVLEEHDPNVYLSQAEEFFDIICDEYGDADNIIFEICNEPNGETTWEDVEEYANKVIPRIREKCPDSLILVGTPDYDKNLTAARRSPLSYSNIMYVMHFYASTHGSDLMKELKSAMVAGFPVFISECGLSESTGDGNIDFAACTEWFALLRSYNLSFAVWSFSNKNESSALLSPSFDAEKPLTGDNLTPAGQWVRELIKGTKPIDIPVPAGSSASNGTLPGFLSSLDYKDFAHARRWPEMALIVLAVLIAAVLLLTLIRVASSKKNMTYDTLYEGQQKEDRDRKERVKQFFAHMLLLASVFATLLYLFWRIRFSIPIHNGWLAIVCNIILLAVEMLGFIESLALYANLMHKKDHPLPKIKEEEYPEVDIFIATYNEPVELLRRTINGCVHLQYPDRSKVHIWLCDDNRRPEMRKLAEEMGVGYFDRPDNKGAKAGNLNHAMEQTKAPYIVTLDADMIPRSCFLMKTIPYFVDANKRSEAMPEGKRTKLGILQTPQCFYDPDVFQHALYAEKTAPNEQDFFYRTIEVAKTATNSVIYGGSNTILSREALEAVGGFYTGSITEDFATGVLIESAGYVSLAIPEPLASGTTPHTYKEHIQQRSRWGRGVISTAKSLKLFRKKGLSLLQKFSYWSSVIYWYSPLKSLIYLLSPLMFAVFAIPVFACNWMDLLLFWLPMFVMQEVCLRAFSKNSISMKWSGIYEISVMPFLLMPVLRETFGGTSKVFAVTDKSKRSAKRKVDRREMVPFLILIGLSVFGIIRSFYVLGSIRAIGVLILLFWLFRNLYFLIMSLFLVDGRDSNSEPVTVIDAEFVTVEKEEGGAYYGVTTRLNEHAVKVFLDEPEGIEVGDKVRITIEKEEDTATMYGILTEQLFPRNGIGCVCSIEIIDFCGQKNEYLQILYNRIPSLPQSLHRDNGFFRHLMINIAHRVLKE